MAQITEFYTLARFTPAVKWPPDEQRGKVIQFMSQRREVSDELVCAAYVRSWLKKQTHTNRDQAQRQGSGSVADGPRIELRLRPGPQLLLADLHRPPVVVMSRHGEIKPRCTWLVTMQSRMMHVPRSKIMFAQTKMQRTAIR
jgi:hypothetical protein